jgi:hypothetical protein
MVAEAEEATMIAEAMLEDMEIAVVEEEEEAEVMEIAMAIAVVAAIVAVIVVVAIVVTPILVADPEETRIVSLRQKNSVSPTLVS